MDYEGPWSIDLLNLMIPMAEEAELDEKERLIGAVSTLFAKDGLKEHRRRADKLKASIRERQYAARGIQPKPGEQAERDFKALELGILGAAKKGAKKAKKGARR